MNPKTVLANGASLEGALVAKDEANVRRVYGAGAIKRVVTQNQKNAKKLIPKSKYQPHQGSKEVQRRLRQEERAKAKALA